MSIEKQIISEVKRCIDTNDLDTIKQLWREYVYYTEFERPISWDYIFQKIYIHSALKKKKHICDWLDIIYKDLSIISQIALKHIFPYSKYLLHK